MKVAVLIMSTNSEPSLRNVQAMKDTFIKFSNEFSYMFRHEYDFYTYYYDESLEHEQIEMDNDPDYPNYHIIRIGGQETVYRTFEKTFIAYSYLLREDMPVYERFVRLNISAYLNLALLDTVIEDIDEDGIYANALNTFLNGDFPYLNHLYARGDFYITSRKVVKGMLAYGGQLMYNDIALRDRVAVTHVDDTLFGYAYMAFMGENEYYKHLYAIRYNFVPLATESPTKIIEQLNDYAISTRVKTTPAGSVSGYSWDDNEFRLYDPIKIEIIHNYYKSKKYDPSIRIKNLIQPEGEERSTVYMNMMLLPPSQIKDILRQFAELKETSNNTKQV